MKLQDLLKNNQQSSIVVMPQAIHFATIASDRELATQIQIRLIDLGLLEPPADGKFGPISTAALKRFQILMQCNEPEYLGAETAEKLIETKLEDLPTPVLNLGNNLASRIVSYMQQKGYQIFGGSGKYNIVYVEGINADGSLNNDASNQFNDRRMVLQILDGTPKIVGNWEATTEPGRHYTMHPMSAKGAARIKFGQYQAWRVGTHGNSEPHEALVQSGSEVTVHRDLNQDFVRTNDKIDTGYFGINQHFGYDFPSNNIYKASAGCLVGRTRQGHREFMEVIKQDQRYQLNKGYSFYTTIIPGDDLWKS
ncbi:peptidoglycan-binding protein [Lyngbya aestuarii]|uniref:peptidoglycan-binding protein n=1 Tax=Lyngbya aestuarii TaxID=118322 RepID=UPI00403D8DE4